LRAHTLRGWPRELADTAASRQDIFMASTSYLRLTKSETRELVDRECQVSRYGRAADWQMSNSSFFTAFVVIAALLTVLALVLR
jgi:hypothetical protein